MAGGQHPMETRGCSREHRGDTGEKSDTQGPQTGPEPTHDAESGRNSPSTAETDSRHVRRDDQQADRRLQHGRAPLPPAEPRECDDLTQDETDEEERALLDRAALLRRELRKRKLREQVTVMERQLHSNQPEEEDPDEPPTPGHPQNRHSERSDSQASSLRRQRRDSSLDGTGQISKCLKQEKLQQLPVLTA